MPSTLKMSNFQKILTNPRLANNPGHAQKEGGAENAENATNKNAGDPAKTFAFLAVQLFAEL